MPGSEREGPEDPGGMSRFQARKEIRRLTGREPSDPATPKWGETSGTPGGGGCPDIPNSCQIWGPPAVFSPSTTLWLVGLSYSITSCFERVGMSECRSEKHPRAEGDMVSARRLAGESRDSRSLKKTR